MGREFLYSFLNFLLKIHYVALVCAFFLVPLDIMGGLLGSFIASPLIFLGFLVPIGPLPISLHGTVFLLRMLSLLNNPFLSIAIVVVLKCVVYVFLRGSRLLNRSAILLLLAVAFVIGATVFGILALINPTYTLRWEYFIVFIKDFLPITIPMDLTVLSYVKYRDALNGVASKVWIPVLATLWSSTIWIPVIPDPEEWLEWIEFLFYPIPIAIGIAIWTAITVVQLLFATQYYYIVRKTSQNTAIT